MTKLNGWRLTAAVFAVLFAAMVVREVTGPAPEQEAVPGHPDAMAGQPEPPPAGRADATAEVEERDAVEAPSDYAAAEADEPARDLAIRLLTEKRIGMYGKDWKSRRALLEPRREEVLSILEEWIRRSGELSRAGVPMENILIAYGMLAGADAIPELERLAIGGRTLNISALLALCFVDDLQAVAIVEGVQSDRPGSSFVISTRSLWQGAPVFRDLVRRWMTEPPANHAWIAKHARETVMREGTDEEREALWPGLNDRERLASLSGRRARKWGEPWPQRFRDLVTRGIADEDPVVRFRAASSIGGNTDSFPPELVKRAEAVLLAILKEVPEDRYRELGLPSQGNVEIARERVTEWLRQQETERRKREALAPR